MSPAAALALLFVAGCASAPEDAWETEEELGSDESALISAGPGAQLIAPVTGLSTPGNQSETQVTVAFASGQRVLMATYNDATNAGGHVVYSGGTRTVNTGASLLGWKYSVNDGATWVNGGNLAPPPGWAILWGDPAAVAAVPIEHRNFVFISNIAAPNSKWPGSWVGSFAGSSTPLGGACIARSADGGKTFSFHQTQPCIHNQHQFYDGGSMAAGANGSIFTSYVNVDTKQIDVWHAPSPTSIFSMLPGTPFPGINIVTHPRIKATSNNESTILYVAAQDSNGNIWMNHLFAGEWIWQTPRLVVTRAARHPTVHFDDFSVRTGPQFSFDVNPGASANDNVRILFGFKLRTVCVGDVCWVERHINGTTPLHLDVAHCNLTLTNCFTPSDAVRSGWAYPQPGQTTDGDQLLPNLVYGGGVWKMSFWSRESFADQNSLALFAATLQKTTSGSKSLAVSRLTNAQRPCPASQPASYDYWGDYDGMAYIDNSSGSSRFIRLISDSTGAPCDSSVPFTMSPLHVTSVRFF